MIVVSPATSIILAVSRSEKLRLGSHGVVDGVDGRTQGCASAALVWLKLDNDKSPTPLQENSSHLAPARRDMQMGWLAFSKGSQDTERVVERLGVARGARSQSHDPPVCRRLAGPAREREAKRR